MKSLLFACLFYILFILTKETAAQTHPVKFNLVTGSNGISFGKINGIARDLHGVMWFTDQSNRCLVRYDGMQMTKYKNDPKNSNSLGGTYPECIVADSTGIIWIGFYGMGVDRFDPESNSFTHFRHQQKDPGSLSSDTVSAVLIDHLGNLWVGSNGGLDLLDQKTGKFKHYINKMNDSTSLSYNLVRALYEDHEGILWVGTGFPFNPASNEGGLNRFDRKTETFTRYLSDPKNPQSLINNKVRAIFEDSRGNFWVGTAGDGLHTMDRKTGLFERHTNNPALPDELSRPPLRSNFDHIVFITEDIEHQIWIGTWSNGLIRYDPVSKKTIHFGKTADTSAGFRDNSCWWANASKDGLLWICTQEDNLYRVDLFTNTFPVNIVNNAGVGSFFQETPSELWMGTDSGLVLKNTQKGTLHLTKTESYIQNNLSNKTIQNFVKDKHGNFWIAIGGSGISKYDLNSGTFTNYRHDPNTNASLCSDNVVAIYKGLDSNLWIGTFDKGVDLMGHVPGTFIHYQHNAGDTNSLSNNSVSVILENQPNDIWIGTWNGGGVNRINSKTGKFKHYLPGKNITAIYKDHDGITWVGAEDGLFRYDIKSDDFFDAGEEGIGLNIGNVLSIIEDDQDNLWMGSFAGIYRVNKNRDRVIFYGKENGIPSQTLYYGSVYKAPDGKLFFGGYTGYYSFYPDKIKINPTVPTIDFTNFWINGQLIKPTGGGPLNEPLYKTKEVHLSYNQNIISFSFSPVDYGSPDNKKVFYKLDNYDKEWRQPGSEARAYYFNLPPGKYRFRVKAVNSSNGIWQEKSIVIFISSPWWSTWWAYSMYALLLAGFAYSIHRYQKARVIKAERERARTKELVQAKEIERAYHKLRTTQSQLVQSEKMASLGELTAGIAHEIQNPLNFVNNFSEVNRELLTEMNEEIAKGNYDEVKAIAKDITDNEEKIIFHGKRADSIVKGMLQHSRSSSGIKEPTGINALADEYLRLSYHGLRAKDKTFNATFKTDFDDTIGNINIIPQDIGRVILNLINNAFYAVDEKKKQAQPLPEGKTKNIQTEYEPTVVVSTKKISNKVEISVKDNGNGISQKIQDKIFQPFFTTKPTGQGTGLGLSLSYDIIKAHGGELKVETKEGEFSEFIIQLPV